MSDESAQSIGKMLGAQTVIIGSFVRMGNNYRLRVNGINTQSAQYESSVSMTVSGRDDAISLLTGEIAPPEPAVTAKPTPAPAQTVQTQPAPVLTTAAPASTAGKTYKIGDQGPGGGIVFFDAGLYINGWRYLEAAPVDSRGEWGNVDVSGTYTEAGFGKVNTQLIINALRQKREINRAAQLCAALNINGFKDWYLPNKDELNWIYVNLKKKGLGGFTDGLYWSSSQSSSGAAWHQRFSDGNQSYGLIKNLSLLVRAVRAF
ncbi:Lcl domain-containing protein [Breznakiellaceae bacterium SP9]